MPSRLPSAKSSALCWLILGVLLLGPAASVVGAAARQVDPAALDMTVLVDGTTDATTNGDLSLSAALVTFAVGQSSTSLLTAGTTFLVIARGAALLDTNQRLPGLPRASESDPAFDRRYDLAVGARVTLRPGTRFKVRNDGEVPAVVYLVSLSPADAVVGR